MYSEAQKTVELVNFTRISVKLQTELFDSLEGSLVIL